MVSRTSGYHLMLSGTEGQGPLRDRKHVGSLTTAPLSPWRAGRGKAGGAPKPRLRGRAESPGIPTWLQSPGQALRNESCTEATPEICTGAPESSPVMSTWRESISQGPGKNQPRGLQVLVPYPGLEVVPGPTGHTGNLMILRRWGYTEGLPPDVRNSWPWTEHYSSSARRILKARPKRITLFPSEWITSKNRTKNSYRNTKHPAPSRVKSTVSGMRRITGQAKEAGT